MKTVLSYALKSLSFLKDAEPGERLYYLVALLLFLAFTISQTVWSFIAFTVGLALITYLFNRRAQERHRHSEAMYEVMLKLADAEVKAVREDALERLATTSKARDALSSKPPHLQTGNKAAPTSKIAPKGRRT